MAAVGEGEWPLARRARTRATAERLRAGQGAWFADWRRVDGRGRHRSQLAVLSEVLGAGLDAVDARLTTLPDSGGGAVYRACRELDVQLGFLARLWAFYRDKLDQRRDRELAPVLAAADDLVWACHAEAGATSLPITHLVDDWSPRFHPRDRPPEGLSPPDAALAAVVRELPLPVIDLPRLCQAEPWWLVLCAHEVGHHVLAERSPDGELRGALGDAIAAATGEAAPRWQRWQDEIFADAFAVCALGAAPAWAIAELEWCAPPELHRPGARYPAPAVRLALLHELAGQTGVDLAPLAGLDATSLAHAAVAADLALVPAVARALLALPIGEVPLAERIGERAADFAAHGRAARAAAAIADGLGHAGDPGTRGTRVAAAAVALAYQRSGARVAGAAELIHAHADPATRAGGTRDAAAAARRLVALLPGLTEPW